MAKSTPSIAFLALLQLLAVVSAAPRPQASSTVDLVQTAETSYVFPDLVPAGTVDMAVYSTGSQKDMTTELPTILKERDDDADPPPPVVTTAGTTYTFPDLVPAGTVNMQVFSTGNQPTPSAIGVIMKDRI